MLFAVDVVAVVIVAVFVVVAVVVGNVCIGVDVVGADSEAAVGVAVGVGSLSCWCWCCVVFELLSLFESLVVVVAFNEFLTTRQAFRLADPRTETVMTYDITQHYL